MALLEKLNDYAQAGLKLAKVKMADADRKMADADARLARVVALTAFFKTSVKL